MSFAYPILAVAAVLCFFAYIALFAVFQKKKTSLLSKFAAATLLPTLEANLSKFKVWLKGVCIALSVALILLALARPQWGYKWEEQKQLGLDIVFALDTSKSMLAEDIKPNRLERAKLAISDIVDRLDGDRVGLVAFSGQAFLQCPVTLDYGAFKMSLEALDTNIIQRGGTNIAAAIDEADAALAKTKNQKIIILISDGEELESSGVARAERISKEENAKIFTLGVGSTNGEPIPVRDARGNLGFLKDENGKLVSSILNESLLKAVAEATGGFYAPLADNGMDEIFEKGISKMSKSELSSKMKKVAIERFQIPLAIAIAILVFEFVLGTRRIFARKGILKTSAIVPALILCAILPNLADAQGNPPSYKDLFNAGVDAYNAKDFEKAKNNFLASMLGTTDFNVHSNAYQNIGNIEYENAKASYEKLAAKPDAKEKSLQDLNQAKSSVEGGKLALQKGLQALKDGGETALKEKSLQDQLKAAVSSCEQSQKALAEDQKKLQETEKSLVDVSAQIALAKRNFENSVELDKNNNSASQNLQKANNANNAVLEMQKQLKEIANVQTKSAELIKKLVEELKKLIRDEDNKDNKNNQQNQQQNQQNNQDKQDKQDNKNKQNQKDQQNNKQDKNNQNKEDKSDSQNQQDKSEQNNKDSQSKPDKQDSAEQNNKQDNEQNKPDSAEQNSEKSDLNKDKKDKENNPKSNEQAANSEPEKEQKAEPKNAEQADANKEEQKQKEDEVAAKSEAQKENPAPDQSAQELEKSAQKQGQDYRAAAGVMTRREASQVLDSMKDNEKKLPMRGYGTQRRRYEDKNYKDW